MTKTVDQTAMGKSARSKANPVDKLPPGTGTFLWGTLKNLHGLIGPWTKEKEFDGYPVKGYGKWCRYKVVIRDDNSGYFCVVEAITHGVRVVRPKGKGSPRTRQRGFWTSTRAPSGELVRSFHRTLELAKMTSERRLRKYGYVLA